MSIAYCALPEPPLRLATRVARLVRLLAQVLRMWVTARVAAPYLSGRQRRRLIERSASRLMQALQVEVRIAGTLPRAEEAALIVANHVSWLDTYAIHCVQPARFVAKAEVAAWPLIGTIAARFGTLFIRRGSYRDAARMVGSLAQALCEGHSVAAFPEATTSAGSALLKFFPAVFQSAVITGARVQPVAIRYVDAAGRRSEAAAYVGDMSIADSLRLLLAEPRLVAEVTFCPPIDPQGLDRRTLALAARRSIATALGHPVDVAEPPAPLRRAA